MKYLFAYLLTVNAAGFAFMLADKQKARHHAWRIPEATLLGIAAAGGSLGTLLCMLLVRHKIRRPGFIIGVPLLLVAQLLLIPLAAQIFIV